MNEPLVTQNDDPLFVFDLDGVITNPSDSSIDETAVGHIHTLIEEGAYAAVNTGRSYKWVQSNLLDSIEKMGGSKAFNHFYIVCEKGGESIEWLEGEFVPQPSRFALSKQAQKMTRQLYEENKTKLLTMFWDASKLTMATIEKHPMASLEQFKTEQQFLVSMLSRALAGQNVTIDATTIATDVQSPEAGKHAGAELIYEWMTAHRGAAHQNFISFGDSRSDYEMARYFAQKGARSAFVFVGAKTETFTEDPSVNLVRTEAEYAAGTREYFEKGSKLGASLD